MLITSLFLLNWRCPFHVSGNQMVCSDPAGLSLKSRKALFTLWTLEYFNSSVAHPSIHSISWCQVTMSPTACLPLSLPPLPEISQ
jgi:hypothetical protein